MKKIFLIIIVFIGLFITSGCEHDRVGGPAERYYVLSLDQIEYDNENFKYTEKLTIEGAESDYFKSYNTYEKFHETFNDEKFSKYDEEYFLENSVFVLNINEKWEYNYVTRENEYITVALSPDKNHENFGYFEITRNLISKKEVNKNVIIIVTFKGKFSEGFDSRFAVQIEDGDIYTDKYYIVYDFKQYEVDLENLEYSKNGKAYMIYMYEDLDLLIDNEIILDEYHISSFDYYNYSLVVIPLIEDKKYEYQNVIIDNGIITINRKEILEEDINEERKNVLIIQSENIFNPFSYEFLIVINDI